MAFLLGSIFFIPTVTYGINEMSNGINDIVNFDYKKYIENKISNMNKKSQIAILELELKQAESSYQKYNDKYKKIFKSDEFSNKSLLKNIKHKREHYMKLSNECKIQIRQIKSELVI